MNDAVTPSATPRPAPAAAPVETEIKLLAPRGDIDAVALRTCAAEAGVELGPPTAHEQLDIYLDDDALHLARSGAGLRVRTRDADRRLTLKLQDSAGDAATALRRREEHELPWRGPAPATAAALPPAVRDRVEPLLYDAALRPIVQLRTRRTTHAAKLDDGSRAELCVDRVVIEDRHGTPADAFQEIEIELLGASPPAERWLDWAARLRAAFALQPADCDKLERALRRGGIDTRSANPAPLRPELTLRRAALQIFAGHLARIQAAECRVRLDTAAAPVHKLRVACRRLRAALQSFAPCFAPGELAPLARALRDTARAFGAVRDLDVLIDHLRTQRGLLPAALRADHDAVLQRLARRRRRKHRRGRDALRHPGRLRAFAALRDFVERPRSHELDLTPRLRDGARHLLDDAVDDVLAQARRVHHRAAARDVHELRIRMKRLRYTAENFAEIWASGLAEVVAHTTALQDVLGEFHDAEVALARLDRLGQRAARKRPRQALAIGCWLQLQERRRLEARRAFMAQWAEFDLTGLRPALHRTLARPGSDA